MKTKSVVKKRVGKTMAVGSERKAEISLTPQPAKIGHTEGTDSDSDDSKSSNCSKGIEHHKYDGEDEIPLGIRVDWEEIEIN